MEKTILFKISTKSIGNNYSKNCIKHLEEKSPVIIYLNKGR
jgi:hypothetical protein